MTKKGVRSVLLMLMVGTLLVSCGIDHALASSYSARGDLTALASSSSGPQAFTYDTLRRLTGSTDATGYQVQYAYDAGSRLTAETTPSGTSTFAWDLLDRATQVTDPQNHVTSYTYDLVGRRLAMLSPNALSTEYTYDASSRITELKLVNSTTNTELLDTLTTYDANGNALASGPDTYTYDSTQQLASWTRSNVQTSYTYDARGNLTSMTGPSGTTSFTVDPATNRLLSVTVPGQYTDTWTYDAAGNPLTRSRSQNGTTQLSSYTWDATGKLSSVIRQGGTTLTFAYAPDGTLTRKEQGTQVTTYAYDFAGVSRESTTSSAPVTYQHNGAGELVSLTWNNQTYYYHFNAHGDTIALSDSTGTRVAEYSYDPWGTVTTNTNPAIPNSYLYCGAYGVRWDADLSLYLMGARWYNPSTGRFVTKDSYPPDLLAPITQNPYQYCGNNPVNRIDPTGMVSWDEYVASRSSQSIEQFGKARDDWQTGSNKLNDWGWLVGAGVGAACLRAPNVVGFLIGSLTGIAFLDAGQRRIEFWDYQGKVISKADESKLEYREIVTEVVVRTCIVILGSTPYVVEEVVRRDYVCGIDPKTGKRTSEFLSEYSLRTRNFLASTYYSHHLPPNIDPNP